MFGQSHSTQRAFAITLAEQTTMALIMVARTLVLMARVLKMSLSPC